jgi:aspartate racemase
MTVSPSLRTIGLIGGVSWHSTAVYYQLINQAVARICGGIRSARLVLISLDFDEVIRAARADSEDGHVSIYLDAAEKLHQAGVDFIVICSNTGHRRAVQIEKHTGLRVLHIADVVAQAVQSAGLSRVGLLGTLPTMEAQFIRGRLQENWKLDVVLPAPHVRRELDRLIITEMAAGVFSADARAFVEQAIRTMAERDEIEGVILACTELPILLQDPISITPLFDTLHLHAEAAAAFACDQTTLQTMRDR